MVTVGITYCESVDVCFPDEVSIYLDPSDRIVKISDLTTDLKRIRIPPISLGRVRIGSNGTRSRVNLDEISTHFVDAVIAVEDRRFFNHIGIDPRRMVAAFWENRKAGKIVQCGSRITQQLVKNSFLNAEPTYARKIRECVLAFMQEIKYNKQQILEEYLNRIYFGRDANTSIHALHGPPQINREYAGCYCQISCAT